MATPSDVATPYILRDPGYLFRAAYGTADPSWAVTGGVFSDAWPVAFVPMGATKEGSVFKYETSVEPIMVAEFFDPLAQVTTERSGSFAMALADVTATHMAWSLNKAAGVTTGSTTTTMTIVEPPSPGSEVRCVIGWESLDHTVRLLCRQVINASEIELANAKAPEYAGIPMEFRFEVPSAAQPFKYGFAGATRGA
jgi:hypothetical protein